MSSEAENTQRFIEELLQVSGVFFDDGNNDTVIERLENEQASVRQKIEANQVSASCRHH